MVAAALYSSALDDWCTPAPVLDVVRTFAGADGIALDPCANARGLVNARIEYRLDRGQDGLALPWDVDVPGIVFVNPPYGRAIGQWVTRALSCNRTVVMLLPSRTDTTWFHEAAAFADALCFWRRRITFMNARYAAPFPSVMCLFGRGYFRFRDAFSNAGLVVRP
jgi:hypothetical protein